MASAVRSAIARSATAASTVAVVGPLATTVTFLTLGLLLEAAGLAGAASNRGGRYALAGCSLVVGTLIAIEAAAVRIDGVRALGRGPRWLAFARYLLAIGGGGTVLLAVSWVGLSAAVTRLTGEAGAATYPGLLVAFTGPYVLYRSVLAFVAGFRDGAT